jgi:hypothetical protein
VIGFPPDFVRGSCRKDRPEVMNQISRILRADPNLDVDAHGQRRTSADHAGAQAELADVVTRRSRMYGERYLPSGLEVEVQAVLFSVSRPHGVHHEIDCRKKALRGRKGTP